MAPTFHGQMTHHGQSGSYVKRGQMSPAEHTARDTALWTVYLQDVVGLLHVDKL
jgi:hypothetical protein